jgi:predicted ATP-grasp superfamily ATP-dependent carboligase
VDCVIRDGVPYPVEINPRYTASVEVVEYATGLAALALHRRVFDPKAPATKPLSIVKGFVAKAILFAQAPLIFPGDGPWTSTLEVPIPVQELPAFADIPAAGEPIEAGQPILTFFARADAQAACLDSLQRTAADLDHWLFKR